jgi:peroxiredoxin Q/BCP
VAYFAASTDDPDKNRSFAESLEVDYPILSDPGGEAARAFGVLGEDGRHARRWTYYIGVEGSIQYIDREVKPASAGTDIAERLAALGVKRRSAP